MFEHVGDVAVLVLGYRQVLEDFIGIAFGPFAIETFDQRDPFVAIDLAGANFLGGVIGCAPDAEFDVGRVVVEVVDLVVERIVFRIRSRRALGGGAEPAMFDRVIVAILRTPFQIVP